MRIQGNGAGFQNDGASVTVCIGEGQVAEFALTAVGIDGQNIVLSGLGKCNIQGEGVVTFQHTGTQDIFAPILGVGGVHIELVDLFASQVDEVEVSLYNIGNRLTLCNRTGNQQLICGEHAFFNQGFGKRDAIFLGAAQGIIENDGGIAPIERGGKCGGLIESVLIAIGNTVFIGKVAVAIGISHASQDEGGHHPRIGGLTHAKNAGGHAVGVALLRTVANIREGPVCIGNVLIGRAPLPS